MKFALISVSLLLLATLFFGCGQHNNTTQEVPAKQEAEVPAPTKKLEEVDSPIELKQPPKEQKSERSIKKKKPKNALDTLRPKTA